MLKWKWYAMADVYVGMGSNLGGRRNYLSGALAALERRAHIIRLSSVYESEPVGGPPNQRWYLNMVVRVQVTTDPYTFLAQLLQIEQVLGRVRTVASGPRTLDLDLLLWDDLQLDDPRLTLPHPRMAQRRFVLEPLREIHPNPDAMMGLAFSRAWAAVLDQPVCCRGALRIGARDVAYGPK